MSCQINAFIHAVSGQAVMHKLLLTTKCDSGNFFQRLLYKLKAHINICINGHLLTTLLCLDNQFLLHDAMLAWYMLSSCVCVWVHLSVTSRYCIETTGRIELVFGMDASSTDPMLQNKGNLSGTLSKTLD